MTFKTCSPQILITLMCPDVLFYAMTVILSMNGIHYNANPQYYICLFIYIYIYIYIFMCTVHRGKQVF